MLGSVALADDGSGTGVFRRRVTTRDGVALAMYRYVPAGGGQLAPPVLMVPDFGMNRAAFDLAGAGLAPWLRAQGREVFVLEPRGHGASAAPADWSLSDLVELDLPAAVEAIGALREEPVDLVLHGYSGTLALAATTRELRGRVGRVVALSTPALVELPNAHAATVLERGGRLGSMALDPQGADVFELLFARHGKFRGRTLELLRRTGFSDLSPAASAQLLGWMRSGDLTLGAGSDSVRSRLSELDRPTLQLLGLRNNWAHVEHGTPLRELAPRAPITLRVLSYVYFMEEDYNHLSILHGAGAPGDVFPLIETFLSGEAVPNVARPGGSTATEAAP